MAERGGGGRTPSVLGEPSELLAAECSVFTRYLVGREADAYVQKAYLRAHARDARLALAHGARRRDVLLLELARRGARRARAADAYARVFAPTSRVRKKLVLLLAILETRSPFDEALDRPLLRPVAPFLARFVLETAGFVARVALVAAWLPFGRARAPDDGAGA